MEFTLHTTESAPAASRETLSKVHEHYGFIPNLAAVIAESPGAFAALLGFMKAYDSEQMALTPLERQVVMLSASAINHCEYCTAAHSMLSSNQGLSRDEIDKLQQGETLSDDRLQALRHFTEQLVQQRGVVDKSEIESFIAAGFTKAQVLEVVCGVALKSLTNYANHIAQPELNEQFAGFLPNWT